MSESVKARLTHALLSMLLAAGLLLPLMGILEPSFLSPSLLLWCTGIIVLFELASLNRVAAVVSACAGVIGFGSILSRGAGALGAKRWASSSLGR